jgi:hypothetical protein
VSADMGRAQSLERYTEGCRIIPTLRMRCGLIADTPTAGSVSVKRRHHHAARLVDLVVPLLVFSAAWGQVAQLVEHRTENPGVGGSIPSLPTIFLSVLSVLRHR